MEKALTLLDTFLEQWQTQHKSLIYCTVSTFWTTQNHLLDAIVEQFTRRDDLDLVTGLVGRQPTTFLPESYGVGFSCRTNPLYIRELENQIDCVLGEYGKPIRERVYTMQRKLHEYDSEGTAIKFLQDAFQHNSAKRLQCYVAGKL